MVPPTVSFNPNLYSELPEGDMERFVEAVNEKLNSLGESLAGRITVLESKLDAVQTRVDGIERLLRDMVMDQTGGNSHRKGREEIVHEVPIGGNAFQANPLPMILDFPWFEGIEVHDWIFRAENYFRSMKTSPHLKVEIASHHLFGNALYWLKVKMKSRGDSLWGWEDFTKSIITRFSPLDDPFVELVKLRQTAEVESYVNQFYVLFGRTDIGDNNGRSLFLVGLEPELAHFVRMRNPQTFDDAVELAFLTEPDLPSLRAMAMRLDPLEEEEEAAEKNADAGREGFEGRLPQ